ncbi:Imm43 family immunity protein [Pseudomonas sp. NPDC087817]|uniref:Imm43 family immunity protein n=1 Tax=Pseudomonas sp. NPDC087817 TaxID=3364451 RepID=UPI0038064A53
MEYYVLSQKEESDCPRGLLNANLYDKFYPDAEGVKFGFFPWYAEKINYTFHTPYPEGMVLISKDRFYDFDIRSVSRFYIASDDFLSVCAELDVGIADRVAIDVVSTKGEPVSVKTYNAVLFEELDARSDTGLGSTFVEEDGLIFRFKKLVLPEVFKHDLFKFKGMISGSNTLICSSAFKARAAGLKGIEFIPLESVLWSAVKPI